MAYTRTKDEIVKAFAIHRKAIASSCAAFDAGDQWEALRLATSVYAMVHDERRIISVLSQMGIKDTLGYWSSGRVPKRRNLFGEYSPLLMVRIDAWRASYIPKLGEQCGDEPTMLVPFHTWWQKEQIFRDGAHCLTRSGLVFALRNQDGGSHLDPELSNPNYVHYSREGRTFVGTRGQDAKVLLGKELVTMRQIAWELTQTLENYDRKVADEQGEQGV